MINNKDPQLQLRNPRLSLFLAAGITLVLPTLALLFLEYPGLIYKLVTGLLIDILVSFCLMLLASLFLRFPPSAWWMTILHFILLSVIGAFLVGAGFLGVMIAPEQGWKALPAPPERASRFLSDSKLSIFGSTMYIQSISGKSFAFECVTYQGCDWSEAGSTASTSNAMDALEACPPSIKPAPLLTPPLLVKPVDILQSRSCGPDFDIQNKYVLLGDGRILMSSRFWSVNEVIFGLPTFVVSGLLGGIATSITTLVIRGRKKRLQAAGDVLSDATESQ